MIRLPLDSSRRLQWGPASFAGMCAAAVAALDAAQKASMGPGFVRRDVPYTVPALRWRSCQLQWGPASFAGMCLNPHVPSSDVLACFNGARLRSPGCATA